MKSTNLSIPIAIIVAGLIIAGAVIYTNVSSRKAGEAGKENRAEQGAASEEIKMPTPVGEKDHILGNPEAEITMIEYSDTECPFCKRFHFTMKQVMEEFGKEGKVRWVYRHFPLVALHSKAPKEAEATECAAELGGNEKFWQYLDKIFEITPSNNGLDLAKLPEIAEELGLDRDKFQQCLDGGKLSQKVRQDYEDGARAGVRGTPHTVLLTKDGRRIDISGAMPYQETTPGIFLSPNISQEVKDVLCNSSTQLCGIKTAIEKMLKNF